nr:arginase family protein [Azospira sp.]
RLGVRVFTIDEVRQRGLPAVFGEALARVRQAPGGYGVSLDLDVFDPREAPGVGSPEPAGLSQTELMPALAGLAGDPALLALEVMEFNPDRDAGGRTAALLARLIGAVFPRRHGA